MTFDQPQPEILSPPPEGEPTPSRTEPKTELPAALIKTDGTTLVINAEKNGKLRITSRSLDEARVVEPGRQLVIRHIAGQAHVFDVAID